MNNKVLQKVEYLKIRDLLTTFAGSEPGKQLCRGLLPMYDLAEIENEQSETSDALGRLFRKNSVSFAGNRDLTRSIRSLEVESTLSAKELLQIADLLDCTNRLKSYNRTDKEEERNDSLTAYFEVLEPLTPLSTEIRRCILSEDELSDDASSELKRIRRSMIQTNEKIRSQLNHMVNGSYRTYLQDAVITMRNNRYCIPVKAEYKGQVSGMVHDQSSSGSTIFIEPAVIVNLNNQLKELFLLEDEEIKRILARLSVEVSEHTEALLLNQQTITRLDFVFAKAAMAMSQNASKPLFNQDKIIQIRKGRHPLIPKDKIVPIDIHLGKDFDLLIVTGPNTGGKTVSLKTVGLLSLMGQAGLHIPAADRSQLSIFHDIFADIGDEQSIEQNLSTFSSHMTNIVSILKEADSNSLCLFDELGAGTDPTEGAALAIAILRELHNRGIRTMATTHYSELKVFALTADFVENACCEFDVETLRPTYRLLIGIPGKSNAFAISSKLGLPDYIIESAKTQITEDKENFEDLLSDLEQSRTTIEKEHLEISDYKARIKALEEQLRSKREKIDQAKDRILRQANEDARDILQEAKTVADETIRSIHKSGSTSLKDMEASRQKLRGKIDEKNQKLVQKNTAPKSKELKANQLRLGDMVRITSMGLKGTVNSLPDAKGNLFVQCGIIRSQTNIKDLVLIQEDAPTNTKTSYKSSSGNAKLNKSSSISMEINLLGKTVDEAIASLDKYLDDAYLSHLPSVRIVHGKGTGALRNAVHTHLRKMKYVKSFRLGEFGEGDAGVTIAEFQ